MKHLRIVAGKEEWQGHRCWQVLNKHDNIVIGFIGWYIAWKKFCFFPDDKTVYEWDCMRDIALFLENETKNERQSVLALKRA